MTAPEQLIGDAPYVGRRIGHYLILDEIASGGMATVHLAHDLDGASSTGETKFFAAKCMHAHYARDPDFVSMFTDEATLCTLIRHENVVATIDVTQGTEELLLVLELSKVRAFRSCSSRYTNARIGYRNRSSPQSCGTCFVAFTPRMRRRRRRASRC